VSIRTRLYYGRYGISIALTVIAVSVTKQSLHVLLKLSCQRFFKLESTVARMFEYCLVWWRIIENSRFKNGKEDENRSRIQQTVNVIAVSSMILCKVF